MASIASLTTYSNNNYIQNSPSKTLSFIPGKLYSGSIIDWCCNGSTIVIILIDKNNKINQLDPISLTPANKLIFKNLLLYEIIIQTPNYPETLSYNIIGKEYTGNIDESKIIPIIDIEPIIQRRTFQGDIGIIPQTPLDKNNIPYVNIGIDPISIQGIPYSFDVTVGTSSAQIQTNINQMLYQVIILADSANTAAILIGGSVGYQTYPLTAGQVLVLNYVNPYNIYAYSSTTGQKLHVIMMI